ncbi:MAG TPA: flagellar motor protein MotB [Verrucomicrobiales bacterium]|nr:flagellar motor protein MotB [Verrucomicrobiales bacterium]
MNQTPQSEAGDGPEPSKPATQADELGAIRDLLFGEEKRQLDGLQERIEDPGLHAQDVGRVLPQAVTLATTENENLGAALVPAVETALKDSVKRNPARLANAIFPIIGPAIRKSISDTFSRLVQSLNQTLGHSFSPQGLRWRLEAARTGKSFAEVVLAHTLIYRVEQVFLIHKETGLLLQHVTAPHIRHEDAGVVSGMLTAIRDFARDSFQVSTAEALQTLQVGELNVWVEDGPQATVAAVIRGQAPLDFRTALQGAIEEIHALHGAQLEAFDGDAAPFETTRPILEPCLQIQFAEGTPGGKSPALPLLLLLLVLAPLAFWIAQSTVTGRRWSAFVEHLRSEPGIVVTTADRRDGQFVVGGLRDPLAIDPASLLEEFKLKPDKVSGQWEPYQALLPEFILKRSEALLQPPSEVSLEVQDGRLIIRGRAPGSWIAHALAQAPLLAGVHAIDATGLVNDTLAALASLQRQIEQEVLFFESGLTLKEGQEARLASLAGGIRSLELGARQTGRRPQVTIVGHTDASGSDDQNLRLSKMRADHVATLLASRGLPQELLESIGVGAREPLAPDATETEPTRHRRVTFRVRWLEEAVP